MAKIRWRLVVGLVSLGVTVILTIPAPAAAGHVNGRVADIWPNLLGPVAIIWPNDPTVDIIWPNADSPVVQ
jgi:hypothetical protein